MHIFPIAISADRGFRLKKNIMLADNLREMLETKDENHNRMILDLLGDRFAMLDDFCRVMYEKGNSVQAKKKCVESCRESHRTVFTG